MPASNICTRAPYADCENDAGLMPYTTLYADLWAKDPLLPPTQMRAERELLKTATWEFWVKEARENGISNEATLKAEFRAVQRDLTVIFGDDSCFTSYSTSYSTPGQR